MKAVQIIARAEVTIGKPPQEVFDAFISDEGLVAFCRKVGLFAAIAEASTRGALEVGARRSVRMSDGLELEETIAEHDPPRSHGYGWTNPALPLGALIRRADAVWSFEEQADQTHVAWCYAFTLRSPLLWPLGKLLVLGFGGWMQAALDRGRASLEA